MPAIQSIGLGSDNVLKQETIDKLKESEEQAQITPIEKRITKTKKQNTELSTLLVSIAGMKGAQNPLYEELEYLKVSTNTIGDSVDPVVSSGVSTQNINIQVKQLAKQDIIQSKTFRTKEDVLSVKNTNMHISINSRSYEVKIKGSSELEEGEKATKLSDLPSLILESTSGKVTGSIINTGGDTPYTLVLKSKDVGKNNTILVGTALKAGRNVNEETLKETIYRKDDWLINDVRIFGKTTKAQHLGEVIDDLNNLPFKFNTGDLTINGTDIFDVTKNTSTISSSKVVINSTAADGDMFLNGKNIFDTSGFSETKSSTKLNDLEFPLDITLDTLTLNGIDIFNSAKPTVITTSVLNDTGVSGIYKHNNLMLNGVSVFSAEEDVEIESIAGLVNQINLKTDDTNISARVVELADGNTKMELTNEVDGDNIDINSNDPLILSKMRLYKGVTLGSTKISVKDKAELIELINSKKDKSAVKALEVDGNLVLRSTRESGRIVLKANNSSFINQMGFKEGTYNNPIPVKIESLASVISHINNKSDLHNIVASNKDDKLYLEHTQLGQSIDVGGKLEFLEKLNLKIETIQPEKGKLVSNIDDLIKAINISTDKTSVQARRDDKRLLLSATKDAVDITIAGKSEALSLIGLTETLAASIDGEKLEDINTLVKRINEKSERTNVTASIGSDGKITLLNTLGGNIVFLGDEAQINILSFSIDDTINLTDIGSNKALLEKLGISKLSQKLQSAQDSIFKYNGVEIKRDNNNIVDIIEGVEFKLQKVDTENSFTNIVISKDKDTITDSFFEFITAYNSFIRKIADLTKFTYDADNPEDSEAGAFQGKTTISKIPFQLSTILGEVYPDLKISGLISLGLDFSRDGTLTYKEDEIRNKINSNFKNIEDLFRGYKKTTTTGVDERKDGIFTKFNKKINDLTKGSKSVLETFKSSIEQETSRLTKTLKKTQDNIDNRYEQIKKSFIANDAAISKINNNFNALKQQIEYETAKN